jgi:thiosulfate/3-mercaptopyruvate sulfurtransferase
MGVLKILNAVSLISKNHQSRDRPSMSYSHPEYLISTSQLADAISDPVAKLRLFDVTVTLVPASSGYRWESGIDDFQQAHIPGAGFMDLAKDFSDTTSGLGFTLPSAEHLEAAYRAAGIDDDSQVVFYSSSHMMWATRAWWMLNSCGHKNVAVLDGGSLPAWTKRTGPTKPRPLTPLMMATYAPLMPCLPAFIPGKPT